MTGDLPLQAGVTIGGHPRQSGGRRVIRIAARQAVLPQPQALGVSLPAAVKTGGPLLVHRRQTRSTRHSCQGQGLQLAPEAIHATACCATPDERLCRLRRTDQALRPRAQLSGCRKPGSDLAIGEALSVPGVGGEEYLVRALAGRATISDAQRAVADHEFERDLMLGRLRRAVPDWQQVFQVAVRLSMDHTAATTCPVVGHSARSNRNRNRRAGRSVHHRGPAPARRGPAGGTCHRDGGVKMDSCPSRCHLPRGRCRSRGTAP